MSVERTLRRGLLVLSVAGAFGTALELVMLRHWTSGDQLIAWFALGLLATAIALCTTGRPTFVRAGRLLAVVVALTSLFGVFEHVHGNLEAGPLDQEYSATWDTMSPVSQWWTAATGGVGPSPALAPLILAQSAACLALATIGANGPRRAPAIEVEAQPVGVG